MQRVGGIGAAADALAEAQQPAIEDGLFQRRKRIEADRLDPPWQLRVGQCPASGVRRRAASSAMLLSEYFLTSSGERRTPSGCSGSLWACGAARPASAFGSRHESWLVKARFRK